MAAIDFPSAPTMGQEYPFGDFTYVWDGVKWTTKVIIGSTEGSDARYVNITGDTVTGPLEQRTANGVGTSLTSGDGIADFNWNDYEATTRYKIRYDVSVAKWGLHNYDNTGTWVSTLISHLGAEPEGVYVHRPRSSTAQETDPAALTRRDYVDNTFVKKAGDTMTSALYGPSFHARSATAGNWGIWIGGSTDRGEIVPLDGTGTGDWGASIRYDPVNRWSHAAPQGMANSSITRKDYVDNTFVKKTGDTMTGPLQISKGSGEGLITLESDEDVPLYVFGNKGGADNWLVGNMDTSDDVILNSYRHANYLKLKADHTVIQKDPRTNTDQGTAVNSLTRKDYVDNTFVKKTGDTMTGPLVISVSGRALEMQAGSGQSSYVISKINGANNWFVGKGDANDDVSLNSYVYGTSVTLRSDHIAFNKDPRSNAAQGTNTASLTRKDYVDAALLVKADVDRVNTLEATIYTLLARIEALEAQVNPAS